MRKARPAAFCRGALYNAGMTDEQIREVQAAKPVLSDFQIAAGESIWLIKLDSAVSV